jgi:hypothetical protein
MTDPFSLPVITCRAQLTLTGVNGRDATTYDCTLSEGHDGRHQDGDTDQWGIEYVQPEGVSQQSIPFVMHVRPVQDQLTALTARVGLLEAAWTVGGETMEERLARNVQGLMEQIRVHEHQPGAVLIDPAELGSLLKDREELHALRNQAQADVVTADTVDSPRPMKITRDRLHELQTDARRLAALEQAGVDNWSGYDHGMEIRRDLEAEHEVHVCTVDC